MNGYGQNLVFNIRLRHPRFFDWQIRAVRTGYFRLKKAMCSRAIHTAPVAAFY